MINPRIHTLMFMRYLTILSAEDQHTCRPTMLILCDPDTTARQREVAYNYIDSYIIGRNK